VVPIEKLCRSLPKELPQEIYQSNIFITAGFFFSGTTALFKNEDAIL
jgi:hypothetical protein